MASWKSRGLTPNATTLAKLADYFGVIMADLLDGNEAKIYNTGFVDGAVAQDMHNQEVERNVVKIAGRDGRFIEKHLSNEQLEALMTLIEQLPEAPDNI